MFTYTTTVTLRDADAAGILFFARHFYYAHDAYEAFMASRGVNFLRLVRDEGYFIPLVRAEADYKLPLLVGDKVTVRLRVEEVQNRKFVLVCELCKEDGDVACTVRTVHVTVQRDTGRSVDLPEPVRKAMENA